MYWYVVSLLCEIKISSTNKQLIITVMTTLKTIKASNLNGKIQKQLSNELTYLLSLRDMVISNGLNPNYAYKCYATSIYKCMKYTNLIGFINEKYDLRYNSFWNKTKEVINFF